ncbi:MAG TPA: hypothetical protein VFV83_03590, partial [Chthoniobacteraceae bacterium]|nr:hypothetical protein [Chthoniobacteraceae bacterium]
TIWHMRPNSYFGQSYPVWRSNSSVGVKFSEFGFSKRSDNACHCLHHAADRWLSAAQSPET